MKKKLEADLISIAHRILQLKNKSDINQLYLETQKLYEKLSVLRFVEEHFSEAKPTIGIQEISKEIESFFDKSEVIHPESATIIEETVVEKTAETTMEETTPLAETVTSEKETVVETEETVTEEIPLEETVVEETIPEEATEMPLEQTEEILNESVKEKEQETVEESEVIAALETEEESETSKPETAFEPAFELPHEEVQAELETPKKKEAVQISFEDLLGGNYNDTFFVKKQQVDTIPTAVVDETPKEAVQPEEAKLESIPTEPTEKEEPKTVSLNEKLAKGINIDLNDRLAFIKHLFGNSSEDYNRVLSQLITFDTFYETRDFVQEMVKPDYNNWEGKQEYEERFMDIIEKKFL